MRHARARRRRATSQLITTAQTAAMVGICVLAAHPAYAACPGDQGGYVPDVSCTTDDGRHGTRRCDENSNFVCVPTERLVTSGDASASYMILTVVYAPPGSSDCSDTSTVEYASGSSIGSTVTMKSSIKDGVSFEAEAGQEGAGSASLEFDYSQSYEHSDEITIKRSEGYSIEMPGPCSDGINHDWDKIYVWLGPGMTVNTEEAAGCRNDNAPCDGPPSVKWGLKGDGEIQFVTVSELKDPKTIRPGVLERFQAYGLVDYDYAAILDADPLAWRDSNSTDVPDSNRFVSIGMSIPYEPPVPGEPIGKFTHKAEYSMDESHGTTSSYQYDVKVKVSANVASFLKVSIGADFEWTNSNSGTNLLGTTDSATVSIMQPGAGYTGPTAMNVYYDTVYKSFAFVPAGLP